MSAAGRGGDGERGGAASAALGALLADVRRVAGGGDLDGARARCRSALTRFPGHPDAYLHLAQVELRAGRGEAAIEALAAAARDAPGRTDVHAALGETLLGAGRFAEAAQSLQRALALEPGRADLLARLGVARQESGALAEAIEAYRAALAVSPRDPLLHYNLGTALKRLHRFDEALAAYDAACRLAPGDADLELRYANLLVETSHFEAAAERLERVAAARPDSALALSQLSYAHKKLGNGRGSVAAAERLVALTGGAPPALMALSSAYLVLGDAERALAVCERGLAAAPGSRQFLSDKAIALNALGRTGEADRLVDFERLLGVTEIEVPAGYDGLAGFNAALVAQVRSHPSLDHDGISLSCHNGATSDELLVRPTGAVADLQAAIESAARRHLDALPAADGHPWLAGLPAFAELEMSAWATLLRSQGYQHGHIHPSAWLSGVYYVSLPGVIGPGEGDESGWIEFGRAPFFYACEAQRTPRALRPHEGMLVFFPSYFYHRTIAFDSPAERITIAFDFRVPAEIAGAGGA